MKFKNDIKERIIKTFIQSLLSYIVVNIAVVNINDDKDIFINSLIALFVGAVASALCAIMNLEKGDNSNDIQ